MPRYYFDIKDGTRLRDHTGVELPNDYEAMLHAKNMAREVGLEEIKGPQRFVSVIHEKGQEVGTVPILQFTKAAHL